MKRKMAIRCPTCKRAGDWFAGPYGPFCSHRCKLIDLGKWFGEEHVMSEPMRAEDPDGKLQNSGPRQAV